MGIHNYEKKLEQTITRVKKANTTKKNKELLLEFNDHMVIAGLSKSRIIRCLQYLAIVSENFNKDFDRIEEKQLKKYVSKLQQSSFTAWTKQTYKVIIRKFFQWLAKEKGKKSIVEWITIRISRSEMKTKQVGDMLTKDEIFSMIKKADNIRDKALIAILAESGARAGEVGNALIKSVNFDEYGVLLALHGKTGTRTVRLIWSVPYISNWLNVHPFKDDPGAFLWVNTSWKNKDKHLKYGALRKIFKICSERAGIKKKVHPHIFRHSLASYYAEFLTEFQMNQFFGWVQGSKMAATYVHMSAKNVNDAILSLNGIKPVELHVETMPKPKICPRCDTVNTAEDKCCVECGGVIDIRYAAELQGIQQQEEELRSRNDKLMNVLLQDKNVQELLLEKLTQLGSGGSLL